MTVTLSLTLAQTVAHKAHNDFIHAKMYVYILCVCLCVFLYFVIP